MQRFKKKAYRLGWSAAALTWVGLITSVAWADTADRPPGLDLTTDLTLQNDSNYYRLPPGLPVTAINPAMHAPGNLAWVADAGVDGLWQFSRQQISLIASENRVRNVQSVINDYDWGSYQLSWNGAFAEGFSGAASTQSSVVASSFADLRATVRNLTTQHANHEELDFSPRPDRRVAFLFDQTEARNSSALVTVSNYRQTQEDLRLAFSTPYGRDFVFNAILNHTEYPNRLIVDFAPIDNSYLQRTFNVGYGAPIWGTVASVNGTVGHTSRHNQQVPQRDLGGPTGIVALTLAPRGLVTAQISGSRDLAGVDDLFRIYSRTTDLQESLDYAATRRIDLVLLHDHTAVVYGGDPRSLLSELFPQPVRIDSIQTNSLRFKWILPDDWSAEGGVKYTRQISNITNYTSRDTTVDIALHVRFHAW